MSSDDESSGELVRVRANSDGVEVRLSERVPALVRSIMPVRWLARREAKRAVLGNFVERLRSGDQFDGAELVLMEELLGEGVAKYARLQRIGERAAELIATLPASAPGDGSEQKSQPTVPETPSDWINRFREDASLVDDEIVREAYARILVDEARNPGAVSMRTLGVLRYMDRGVAENFANLQKVLIDQIAIPMQSSDMNGLLKGVGLTHSALLDLEDAGLLNASAESQWTGKGNPLFLNLSGHRKALMFRKTEGQMELRLEIHVLTPAGRQLARLADFSEDSSAFGGLVDWICRRASGAEVSVADLPLSGANLDSPDLKWSVIRPL